MTFQDIQLCLSGNTESAEETRNKDVYVKVGDDMFKVNNFTETTNGHIVLLVERI